MCNALVTGLLCTSSRHAPWSACHCIANNWDLLSFPLVPFVLEGRRLYPDLMRKLIQSGAMCQMSFFVRDFCRALSQLIHCPCCGCWTAFWTLLEFSQISLMKMSLFSFRSAFDHHFVTDIDEPSPLWSGWVCPITSLAWSVAVNVAAASILLYRTERLRDFFGLKFILHPDIKPSRRSNIWRVSASFKEITVVPSINAFRGGM